jgi:hypothetical protein
MSASLGIIRGSVLIGMVALLPAATDWGTGGWICREDRCIFIYAVRTSIPVEGAADPWILVDRPLVQARH